MCVYATPGEPKSCSTSQTPLGSTEKAYDARNLPEDGGHGSRERCDVVTTVTITTCFQLRRTQMLSRIIVLRRAPRIFVTPTRLYSDSRSEGSVSNIQAFAYVDTYLPEGDVLLTLIP